MLAVGVGFGWFLRFVICHCGGFLRHRARNRRAVRFLIVSWVMRGPLCLAAVFCFVPVCPLIVTIRGAVRPSVSFKLSGKIYQLKGKSFCGTGGRWWRNQIVAMPQKIALEE
ncbi:hypothetical protein [Thalassospira povalilytica]|uniref:hypothetical protein n=1 Tax=Thalassospira povalilytica TaxID=732237 RepID=UPI001478EB4B|nr:hypothetical protein [Thalassospira povalilytica]